MIGLQSVKSGILFLAAFFFAAMLVSSSLAVLNVHAQSSMPNPSVPNFTPSATQTPSMSPSPVATASPSSTPNHNSTNIVAADSVKDTASTSPSQTQLLVIIAVLLAVIVGLIIALIIMNRSQIRNRWRSHSN